MKHNAKGKSWKEHASPYLARALRSASKAWHPNGGKPNKKKLDALREKRGKINEEIKKELRR